jgi:hypothetical protein
MPAPRHPGPPKQVHADVDAVGSLVKENAKLRELLFNPVVDGDKKKKVLTKLSREAGACSRGRGRARGFGGRAVARGQEGAGAAVGCGARRRAHGPLGRRGRLQGGARAAERAPPVMRDVARQSIGWGGAPTTPSVGGATEPAPARRSPCWGDCGPLTAAAALPLFPVLTPAGAGGGGCG